MEFGRFDLGAFCRLELDETCSLKLHEPFSLERDEFCAPSLTDFPSSGRWRVCPKIAATEVKLSRAAFFCLSLADNGAEQIQYGRTNSFLIPLRLAAASLLSVSFRCVILMEAGLGTAYFFLSFADSVGSESSTLVLFRS